MSAWFDDIRAYLPKYLSDAAQRDLFAELAQFPKNIDSRLYTRRLDGECVIFQGDGLVGFPVVNLPDREVRESRVMIVSNTCDTDPENRRPVGSRFLYCPIVSFCKYENLVRDFAKRTAGVSPDDHLASVRAQRNSSMFFLPRNDNLGEEGIAMLDRINSLATDAIDVGMARASRLFVLSDYGFYMFLFKLSLHLTRIREGVARGLDGAKS